MVIRDESGRFVSHDKLNEAGYKRVQPGDFVIHLRSFQGGFAHSPVEGITSPAYTVFAAQRPDEQFDRYWKHVFKSESFIDGLRTVTYGIRDGRSIGVDEFFDTELIYPDYSEQCKIGEFFTKIDDLITLRQHELDKLKSVKQAFLQDMFPRLIA
jgi:type I restriction enzyme S subunit